MYDKLEEEKFFMQPPIFPLEPLGKTYLAISGKYPPSPLLKENVKPQQNWVFREDLVRPVMQKEGFTGSNNFGVFVRFFAGYNEQYLTNYRPTVYICDNDLNRLNEIYGHNAAQVTEKQLPLVCIHVEKDDKLEYYRAAIKAAEEKKSRVYTQISFLLAEIIEAIKKYQILSGESSGFFVNPLDNGRDKKCAEELKKILSNSKILEFERFALLCGFFHGNDHKAVRKYLAKTGFGKDDIEAAKEQMTGLLKSMLGKNFPNDSDKRSKIIELINAYNKQFVPVLNSGGNVAEFVEKNNPRFLQ